MIGLDMKAIQHLRGHVAMLAGVQPDGAGPVRLLQCVINRGQLDDFGPGPGHDEQLRDVWLGVKSLGVLIHCVLPLNQLVSDVLRSYLLKIIFHAPLRVCQPAPRAGRH
ncbi:hypothetical protein SDC9_206384 [bioreactor metagenome]|uniref:Uncharacterized protein n=1 Tax=bioreactor metagenome TaxID=1076179 RepID=A0A645JGF3_9ZZZZ